MEIIRRHAANLLGLQDTQAILDALKKEYPAVVEEVLRERLRDGKEGLRVTDIQKIFQGLLRERVSIRNKVSILEAIATYAPYTRSTWYLVEKVRQALSSQICQQYADDNHIIRVLGIDPALEQKIIDSRYEMETGTVSALEPQLQHMWIKAVSKSIAAVKAKENGWMPVIVCSEKARYLVKNSTDRELPDLAVLSAQEISQDFKLDLAGMIKIESTATE